MTAKRGRTLEDLNDKKICCIFCTKNTNQNSRGGYFKDKYVCENCADEFEMLKKIMYA